MPQKKNKPVTAHPAFQLNLSNTNPLEFSSDIFAEITQYLDIQDINALARTNKALNRLVQECQNPYEMRDWRVSFHERGTYAELQQLFSMHHLQIDLSRLIKNLESREQSTFSMHVWPIVLVLSLAVYLTLEPYLIYKAYHGDESREPFRWAAAFFGSLMPAITCIVTMIACGAEWEIKIKKAQLPIAKSEWKYLLSKINEVLDSLEKIIPTNDPNAAIQNDQLKQDLANLKKKKLPIAELKTYLKDIRHIVRNKQESLSLACFFKHSPKPETNDEVRIKIEGLNRLQKASS